MKIMIKLIVLIIGFFVFTNLYKDMIRNANLSKNGEIQFEQLKSDISKFALELNVHDWSYGAPRIISGERWSYSGAYLNLPKCISFSDFEKIIMKQGFNSAFGGASYCKKDINILNIRAENEKILSSGDSTKYLLCGKIIFNLNWENGQNSKNANCR